VAEEGDDDEDDLCVLSPLRQLGAALMRIGRVAGLSIPEAFLYQWRAPSRRFSLQDLCGDQFSLVSFPMSIEFVSRQSSVVSRQPYRSVSRTFSPPCIIDAQLNPPKPA
jgi:hypothetical protein